MSTATRRGFLGGAVAGAAVPALTRGGVEAALGATVTRPVAKPPMVRRGRAIAVSANGRRLVVAHDHRRTIGIAMGGHTRIVDVGGQPVGVAVSPDGTRAAVTTGFWDHPHLAIVDLAAAKVLARRSIGPAPGDVVYSHDGRHLLLAGGEQEGTLHVLETGRYRTVARAEPGRVPRAAAAVPGQALAWVTLNADDRVALVDLRTGRVRRELRTPALPDRLAVSPDGARLLLTHGGLVADHITELEVAGGHRHRHAVGRHPSAVAWTAHGARLVALGGESAVVRLGGRRHAVGAAPRGLAVAGRRFWTVSALTGAIHGGRA